MPQSNDSLFNNTRSNEDICFDPLAEKAQTLFGAAYTPEGRRKLLAAMKTRQGHLNYSSFVEYGSYLRRDPDEWNRLWPQALAAEGSFLRPAAQFEVARDLLLEWSIMAPERSLKVLSLGCGAGFETCSLAIMLEESGLRAKNWQVDIYGLDLNPEAIAKAESAVFTEAELEWLTDSQKKKWFTPRIGGFRFRTDLAAPLNLAVGNAYEPETWPWPDLVGGFDLIFCRDLAVEAPPKAAKRLMRILRQALAPTGFIFTGPGECLPEGSNDLQLEERSGVLYYRRGINRIKVNRPHTPKRAKKSAGLAEPTVVNELQPLSLREKSILDAAESKLTAGQAEAARALAIEVLLTALDEYKTVPEAWKLISRIETALGRSDTAKAAEEVADFLAG